MRINACFTGIKQIHQCMELVRALLYQHQNYPFNDERNSYVDWFCEKMFAKNDELLVIPIAIAIFFLKWTKIRIKIIISDGFEVIFYRFWWLCGDSVSSASDWCWCNYPAAVCQCIKRPDGDVPYLKRKMKAVQNDMNKILGLWNILMIDRFVLSAKDEPILDLI